MSRITLPNALIWQYSGTGIEDIHKKINNILIYGRYTTQENTEFPTDFYYDANYSSYMRMNMNKISFLLTVIISVILCFPAHATESIDMAEVRRLAKLSVDEIIEGSPVETFNIENYWSKVHGRGKPLVVFFYSNSDGPSQRLATLIRYIAPHYQNKLSFGRVKVVENGKPDKKTANRLASMYSLDKTPGILFYDNVGTEMLLEDEDYIDADFKDFRTPKMFLWKTYYSAVRRELDNLLAD